MARVLSARPTSLPAATWWMPLPSCRGSTTALRASQGLSGIPEVPSSGLPSPPSSPPLAAITSTNELTLAPKPSSSSSKRKTTSSSSSRRGGATLRIREECERFFCESLQAVFFGEKNSASHGSGLTGVYDKFHQLDGVPVGGGGGHVATAGPIGHTIDSNGQLTPPDDYFLMKGGPESLGTGSGSASAAAWLEIYDFAGGASFRAFVADQADERTLFVFFDAGLVGRDLKKALVALIELADGPLTCQHTVVCVDRCFPEDEAAALMKGLQWAGFSLTTLDPWASAAVDVTSNRWLFMSMDM